jgi:phosphatidylglycerophosphate synthase
VTPVISVLSPAAWAVAALYGVALWAILGAAMRRTGIRTLGPADRVTLARAVLTGAVTALLVDGSSGAALTAVASGALVLDAMDGQVARRTGTVSRFGARFDMESDAFLILVLSVHAAWIFGPWTLAIGAMRYVFVAVSWVLPWLRRELPPSRARKAVAASQGIVLVVAGSGVLPPSVAFAGVAAALGVLAWSFGRDVAWLWRHAARPVRKPAPAPVREPVRRPVHAGG